MAVFSVQLMRGLSCWFDEEHVTKLIHEIMQLKDQRLPAHHHQLSI